MLNNKCLVSRFKYIFGIFGILGILGSANNAAAETTLEDLDTRVTTAENNISSLTNSKADKTALDTEASTARANEQTNAKAIADETNRAKLAETENTTNIMKNTAAIEAETTRAKAAEQANTTAIDTETTRAKAAEKTNADAIAAVKTTADAAASKTYVDTELAKKADATTVNTALDSKADAEDVYTKTDADAKFAEKSTTYTKTEVDNALALKADESDLETLEGRMDSAESDIAAVKTTADAAASKTYVDTELALKADTTTVNAALDLKADAADVYTKTNADAKFADKATTLAGYGIGDAYTKDEIDTELALKADKSDLTALTDRVTTAEGEIDTLQSDMTEAQNDIAAIEADYLTSDDKTELEGKISAEETRAKAAEEANAQAIEQVRSDAADLIALKEANMSEQLGYNIANNPANEKAEGSLVNSLKMNEGKESGKVTSVVGAINANTDAIAAEETRAKGVENELDSKIDTETERSIAADKALGTAITKETNDRKAADKALDSKIDKETYRAKTEEKKLNDKINAETERSIAADRALGTSIAKETNDRKAADATLDHKIDKVNNKLYSGKEDVKFKSITLGKNKVSSIDNGKKSLTKGDSQQIATTATVMKSAENATYTSDGNNVIPSSEDSQQTIHSAISSLDSAIGNMNFSDTQYISDAKNITAAVNKLDTSLSAIDSDIKYLGHHVNDVEKHLRGGIAATTALTALVPNARDSGDTQISIGTGNYSDKVGFAAGMFHYVNDRVLLNAGGSFATSNDWAFRAGVTFGL